MRGRIWRLQVPGQALRGGYVSLGEDWPQLVRDRAYSASAATLLGQAMAAMPLLMLNLKTTARLSLQISQAPPLNLLTVQGSTQGAVRGMIKLAADAVEPAGLQGQLVVTLEPENTAQRFQGIVALEGDGPADWLARYFEQSEQVATRLVLCADGHRAAGLMLQAMPGEDAVGAPDWQQAMNAIDADMLPEEPGEWLSAVLGFDLRQSEQSEPVTISCQCSEQSVSDMLLQLGKPEADELIEEQGAIVIDCGFCGAQYRFDAAQVARLFAAGEAQQRRN